MYSSHHGHRMKETLPDTVWIVGRVQNAFVPLNDAVYRNTFTHRFTAEESLATPTNLAWVFRMVI